MRDLPTEKILIVGPAWVGDMVMAQVVFKAIKQLSPHCQLDVVAPAWSLALCQRMPEVNTVIPLPCQHGEWGWAKRLSLGKQLAEAQYTSAYILPNSWKSALTPFIAKIPKRIGWLGEGRIGLLTTWRKLNKTQHPLMIQRFAALVNNFQPIAVDKIALPKLVCQNSDQQALVNEHRLDLSKPVLALAPGAEFGPAKIWPAAYFAEVANEYLSQGWQVWLLGSPNDTTAGQTIVSLTQGQCINFIGKTTLASAIDLLSLAQAVVCNDSGMMHIAAALGKTVVAVFGSTSPEFTPPLGNDAHVLQLKLACQPCFQRTCHYGHYNCLKELKPQQVITALKTSQRVVSL
jgi:heptosyltransferase-2